ncbi:hypothetical protein ACVW0Y_001113 [Pseudomonas sp. TE3786]
MQGDFSVLNFVPHEHDNGVATPAQGLLRNLNGVLHQQGRVTTDADLTEGQLLELAWEGQAGRDIIGAGVCAVPATEPQGFHVEVAAVVDGLVQVQLRPGRAWVDGILTRLAGSAAAPLEPVSRQASYLGAPLSAPLPSVAEIDDNTRDAVILEVSQEAVHGFQYPQRLLEPALGGPDTAERAFVNFRLRLLRLAQGEDCTSILGKLRDDPASKGHLSVTLTPQVAIGGDCPVVGGGGYSGFEHCLYRIEIAEGAIPRFKWSQWNGGLVGRGRFDPSSDPDRVYLDAGRAAIVNSGLTEFYLEALQYDEASGSWEVVYGSRATLNTDHDLELAAPASFGTLPSSGDSVFIRLWNGLGDIASFPASAAPQELHDGIHLAFDAVSAGNYRPGDYWTFSVRAGAISNPQVLLDHQPPSGIVYHRVPLAEINWSARRNTEISGSLEDCRKRFRPLVNQKVCCTWLVGNGVSSFGDFNSLEEAAEHLPASGGELCLLPGVHRTNLHLRGRHNVKIHGCRWRSLLLPGSEQRQQPLLRFSDCVGIEVCDLDLVTFDGIAVLIDGRSEDSCRDIQVHDCRMIARRNCIRLDNAAAVTLTSNRLHLLDTVDGLASISLAADDVLLERNTLVLLPFSEPKGEQPQEPDDDPGRDPADPCAKPEVLYLFPWLIQAYAFSVWGMLLAKLLPQQPYKALGGIHVRAGSERVRILENQLVGGAGNGITLGGDLDPQASEENNPDAPPVATVAAAAESAANDPDQASVTVTANGQFLALLQDEKGKPLADVDIYLQAASVVTDRSDAQGMLSIKAAPGIYRLDVAPPYQVLRVGEASDQGVLVTAITLGTRAVKESRGFIHDLSIEANDIALMGLSAIGFAPRAGHSLLGETRQIPANDPKAALLAYIDAALLNLALTPLLRATDPVRDLLILNNRLHHNLQNPFTEQLLKEAQFIGRGGISLALVEAARISGNHIHDNGPRAADPVCGVFIGYGDNIEISDNRLSANGADTLDYEDKRNAGLRGGIYLRFAAALTSQLSSSSGRNAALRVHDNRVEQPVGRALTAFAFGPVSVGNNHFNSEYTGLFGLLDAFIGGVLLINLGGIHRLLARTFAKYLEPPVTSAPGSDAQHLYGAKQRYATVAEQALPGGETLFNDNYIRLGLDNRSLTSQVLASLDDLGYSANTSAVYRGDPFFANAVLLGDSVRATASRLREDVTRTLSLLSIGMRMNNTSLNQADHCIVALPTAKISPLPTIAQLNQVLDADVCAKLFADPSAIGQFLISVLQANAAQLGGNLGKDSFSDNQVGELTQHSAAQAVGQINATQVQTTQLYQSEAYRMEIKHGSQFAAVQTLKSQAYAGAQTNRLLVTSKETLSFRDSRKSNDGAAFSGRLLNDRDQGIGGYTVELLRSNGTLVETVGQSDANGFFSASYSSEQTAALEKQSPLFARVSDGNGKQVLRDSTTLQFAAGAELQVTLVLPLRAVPKSVFKDASVIFGSRTDTPATPTPPTTPSEPSTPTEPSVPNVPPKPAEPVPEPKVRTPLAKLELDEATLKQLARLKVIDVEGVLETDRERLAKVLGSEEQAQALLERAKRILDGGKPSGKTTPADVRIDKVAIPTKKAVVVGKTLTTRITKASNPAGAAGSKKAAKKPPSKPTKKP